MVRRARALGQTALVLMLVGACTSPIYHPSSTETPGSASGAAPSSPADVVVGDRLIVVRDDGNLVSMTPDGVTVLPLTSDAGPGVLVSQPVASPDGLSLAWVEVRTGGPSVVIATRAGVIRDQIPLGIAPFFLVWDPTSSRIAYLGNAGSGIGLGVIDQATVAPTDITLGAGSPLYLSWAPDGTQLLLHVGSDTLGSTDLAHELRPLGDAPGTFQAPAWLPDGRTLFDRVHGHDEQLVVADGDRRRVLATFRGGALFEPSPDGTRVAYRIDHEDGSQDGVFVQPIDGGDPVTVTRGETTAFFWSPRSDALLLMTPEGQASASLPLHRWRVWNGAMRFTSEPFLPSPTFFQEYVPFFDQYAQTLTPWSPDGTAFAYAGRIGAESGVWVQPVGRGAAPQLVSDGGMVLWSPPEQEGGSLH